MLKNAAPARSQNTNGQKISRQDAKVARRYQLPHTDCIRQRCSGWPCAST